MAWWPFRGQRTPLPHDDDGAPGEAALAEAVHSLRMILQEERHRLRPDSRQLAWDITERAAEYSPSWAHLTQARPLETAQLPLLLSGRLAPLLSDFLAVPDSQKPGHADALHLQLLALDAESQRLGRRLTRTLTSRLRAHREL